MKRYLLAIDPGLLTGIALVDTEFCELVWSDELDMMQTGRTARDALIEYGGGIEVVMERFLITTQTAKNSQATWSLEGIGMIRWLCADYGADPPTMQSPGDAKAFSTNDKLHNLGLWHRGGKGHANDALRHALLYMVKSGFRDYRILGENSSFQEH